MAEPTNAPQNNRPGGRQGGGQDRRGGGGRRNDRTSNAPREEKQFEEIVIGIDRVARVVKGGRRFRFKALVVVGDKKGKVGVGVSKGADVQVAIQKATDVAKKHLIHVPIKNGTIPHDVEIKLSGARVLLKSASSGTGVIAGGVVRNIIGVAGISDLLSKSLGSSNKVNIAYATIEALRSLVPRDQWLSQQGKPKKAAKSDEVKTTSVKDADEKKGEGNE